ncbi:MAG TPA: Dabb family protein [Candidatus Merdivicinus excrementipullorum]|uniref:Dabb family protein n=1 Tax=Candidatus Merdivicinus excrementipullorum TaxID=2840867 RepID=A0A9D1JZP2_9FIRM|nr:Dabb family protein [Candidatus Merdivicinus excrementipullorum]
MVRHIVMWKLKDQTEDGSKAENAAAIKAGLEGLVGKIDGLLKAEVMVGVPGGMDLCLYSELSSMEALEGYKVHPLHKAVQALVHRSMEERVACDGIID